jgi:glutathione S-transferase
MTVDLHGYQYSVYSWIARLALHEKGVAYTWSEVDPFADEVQPAYLALHPFKRVPALVHGTFSIFETGAITRYIDEGFQGPALQPSRLEERARAGQIISIADSYTYWPLVRQVFSHGVFRPRLGRPSDPSERARGLEKAPHVLDVLNGFASKRRFLASDTLSLADIHLAPMIAYFSMDQDGAALLSRYRQLSVWWSMMAQRPSVLETQPDLPPPS